MNAAAHTPPAIGSYWAGQGGIYCGIAIAEDGQPDGHIILAIATGHKLTWHVAAAWAAEQQADGHTDFHLPTRTESALLYANARQHIEADDWYWTGTAQRGAFAWGQYFGYGYQYNGTRHSFQGCARAVRRLPLESFNPLKA